MVIMVITIVIVSLALFASLPQAKYLFKNLLWFCSAFWGIVLYNLKSHSKIPNDYVAFSFYLK